MALCLSITGPENPDLPPGWEGDSSGGNDAGGTEKAAGARLDRRQILISLAVALACFLPPFIGEATNIALPDLLSSFGLSAGMPSYWDWYGWILVIYLLTSTVFLIPAARAADKIGHKTIFCAGVALLGLGSLGIGFAETIEIVTAMRAVEGIGNALMFGTAIALIARAVGPMRRGTAIGIAMTGVFAGQLAGPLLAGFLTDVFGWQAVYLILVPIALVSFVMAAAAVPKDRPASSEPFDTVGALLFMIGMALFLYGFSKLPGKTPFILMTAGLLTLSVFVTDVRRREKKGAKALIPIGLLLGNRRFSFNNIANFLYYIAIYSMGSLVSLYMTNVWQITAALPRAVIVTTQGLILVLFTIVAGRSYDRLLPKNSPAAGFLFTAAGAAGLLFAGAPTAEPLSIAISVLFAAASSFGIGLLILAAIARKNRDAPQKYTTSAGLILIILGMIILLTCGTDADIWKMIACQASFGVGIAIFVTPNSTAIMNAVTEREYSMASGTLSTTRMLGMAISIGIVSVLKNVLQAGAGAAGDLSQNAFLQMMHGAVLVSVLILAAAAALSWTAEKRKN